MKLASIETITNKFPHHGADLLEFVEVLGFKCIVRKLDSFQVGDRICFIQPDTVLPDTEWAAPFKKMSSRVKAQQFRGEWSEGIVLRPSVVNLSVGSYVDGEEISQLIGVIKYDPPLPQDLNAKGPLPTGIPKTDEERFNNIRNLPYGELCDVTLKVDGMNFSAFHKNKETGVCGRTQEYKLDAANNFTHQFKELKLAEKLIWTCSNVYGGNIRFCGELFGKGIQSNANNPHAKLPVAVQFFSVWLIDERRYAYKGDPLYAFDLFPKIGLPTVEVLERDVVLTPALIQKYAEDLEQIHGVPFEGVVIQHAKGSFKIINKNYDSKK